MNLELKCVFFLTEILNTDKVGHSGRTLWVHLRNTAQILTSWGEPPHVVLAGMFHSIYGTSYFKVVSFPYEGRFIISNLIGREAEEIAYEFCRSDRSKFPWAEYSSHKKELYTVEAANLIDQNCQPIHIKRLLDSGVLSNKASDVCGKYIGDSDVKSA